MSSKPENPTVYKVIGAPGTGKTTRVVGNPELDLDGLFIENLEDYDIDEQMIVTYTNSGVDEAADRLKRMLNGKGGRPKYPKYKIEERVTTIHSQCYHTLDVDQEQVVDYWKKKKFCDKYDLKFSGTDDEDDIMAADTDAGNALFNIYGWLKSNMIPLEEHEKCPAPWEHSQDPQWLMEEWEAYKAENNYIGFSDMIERVVELGYDQLTNLGWGKLFPDGGGDEMEMFEQARLDTQRDPELIRGKGAFVDTKVLYVDEVQDLTPLQWAWYLLQKLVAEKVYIGGDDDQTIYGWAGANPNFMLDEEGDFEVLETTYRIPREIWEECNGVIHQVDKRQEKEVEPNGEGGEVVHMHNPSARQVLQYAQEGTVMILLRARYHIDEFTDKLHSLGIPYDNMSTFDTWNDDIVKMRDALAKVNNGDANMKGDELSILMEYAEPHMINDGHGVTKEEEVMGMMGSGIPVERLDDVFSLGNPMNDKNFSVSSYLKDVKSADNINWYQQQAIMGNINNGNEHMYPERVRIGTIHSSKGKEAETVILGLDSTKTIVSNMVDDVGVAGVDETMKMTDAERRVYYVGMTRASDTLVLAENITGCETVIPMESLLKDYERDDGWTTQQQSYGTDW